MNMTHKSITASLLIVAALGLTACGKKLDGTYKDSLGVQSYEFKSNGTVYISTMGIATEARYVVEDGKVKISKAKEGEQGDTLIFDLKEDGTIAGPLGMELKKQTK